jgi:hypothetical protein
MSAERDVADFKSNLATVAKEFDSGLHAIETSIDLKALSTKVSDALGTLDRFYGGVPGSGAASTAMQKQGVTGADTEAAHRFLEDRGFVYANGRYWKCNTDYQPDMRRTVSGVGSGACLRRVRSGVS